MNPAVVASVAVLLAAVAAAGALAPLRRGSILPLEPTGDPLEDRRLALLLSLKDLEAARASGALEAGAYERLRRETEARLVRILRVIQQQAQDRDSLPAGEPSAEATARGRVIPRWAGVAIVVGALLLGTIPSLVRSVRARPEGSVFTGDFAGAPGDPLAFFEARGRESPGDVAARLDLAHRYLDAGRPGQAAPEYLAAIALDPDNAEAHAHLGLILHMTGRPEGALKAVERALASDPRYPEALFFKGVILLKGLNRPEEAAEALELYLQAAPFGSERQKATALLEDADVATAGRTRW